MDAAPDKWHRLDCGFAEVAEAVEVVVEGELAVEGEEATRTR